ncbi:MAG: acetylglutamate kinase [Acidimicrobiia bacterium]
MQTTMVIKLGGRVIEDEEHRHAVAADCVALANAGVQLVLVHGGGPQISAAMQAQGLEPRFVAGQRMTDAATIAIARAVLVEDINAALVAAVVAAGGRACGGSGDDTRTLLAEIADPQLGLVGAVTAVDEAWIRNTWSDGALPVVATLARTVDGTTVNVNADLAASAVAGALCADQLWLVSDVPGVLRVIDDPGSVIDVLTIDAIADLIVQGAIHGGMLPKLDAAVRALRAGVSQVRLLDGGVPNALRHAWNTPAHFGTAVVQ